MSKVIVVGGGAAGMLAAVTAASNGHQVSLYEKNEKLGKKLFITGKGRCNITNACDTEDLLNHIVTNRKFLYSAFHGFNSLDMIRFLNENGLRTKVERGNRVFPESDKSSDVIAVFIRMMRAMGVMVHLNTEVKEILTEDSAYKGILLKGQTFVQSDAVILATGGLSYSSTGSTGDGYRFAEKMGHVVTPLSPALVPFHTKEADAKELQGLSLKNVNVRISAGKKLLYEEFGEMLFTHYGVSGPVLLSASSFVAKAIKNQELAMSIDLKPALTVEQLDIRVLKDFEESKNKQFRNSLSGLLPSKLIPIILARSKIASEKKVNEISKSERAGLVNLLKDFQFTLMGLRDYNEAIITQGGIDLKGISPSTMESKLISGIYFAGEVLDLDGVTGGFNLQIAWSTAYAAGSSIQEGIMDGI